MLYKAYTLIKWIAQVNIFDMYQWYILSHFRPKKIDLSTNFMGIWKMYRLKYGVTKINDTICIV